ncbi:MAG TPA: hypothetical protein RMH99_07480 [Sandaracinaceae bacterium LLY-WYZ-13_1]|nr:hypothetical protein [Sandaracinaceae bacterium LLY-WYZ-13_1]
MRAPLRLVLGIVLAGVAAAGCKSARQVGHFGAEAFYHQRDHYRIRYLPGADARAALLPPGWSLQNYAHGPEGRPTVASERSRYWTSYAVEHPRRGTREVRAERVDLRFVHRPEPAMMWVRTVPTSEEWADVPLEGLVRGGVLGLAADREAGLDLLGRNLPVGRTEVRVLGHGPARVDGHPAHYAVFETVRAEAGEADRMTVVVVRPGEHRWRYGRWTFPMLVVFGYVSAPARHASFRDDFAGLVSRVDVAPR